VSDIEDELFAREAQRKADDAWIAGDGGADETPEADQCRRRSARSSREQQNRKDFANFHHRRGLFFDPEN
jgi:hypothetical protein